MSVLKKTTLPLMMVALVLMAFPAFAAANDIDAQEFPPNAQPGKCYAKCVIPEAFENYTERVLAKEASTRLEVVPAVYETVTEQVLAEEASTRLEVVPAVYETVEEKMLIKPASTRLETVAAVYENITETVEVSPATTRWEKRDSEQACLSENPEDCRVWCLVDIPAVNRTVTKRVLKTPASTREIEVPAQYKTVKRRVVKTPATTRTVEIPAKYQTITKTVLAKPATTRTVEIPAEYQNITRSRQTRGIATTEWREVLCAADITAERTRSIQRALRERGFDPGPIDNVIGRQTREALLNFQRKNGLPEGSLDVETLAALGIEIN